MYKKCYKLLNSLSEYAKDNRKYQEILVSKYNEIKKVAKVAKVMVPLLCIVLIELIFFASHQANDFIYSGTIVVLIVNLLLTGITGVIIFCIVFAIVYILTYGRKDLFNCRDLEYVNEVLRECTAVLLESDFRYVSSHSLAVNYHGKDHIFDTDIIKIDENRKTVIIQSSLQVVESKLEEVVELTNKKEI